LQQQLGGQPGQPSQLGLGVKEPLLKRVRNVMLYALIAALIVVAVVGVAVAIGKRRGRIEVGEEMPRVVRPSELLISLMENLSYNERRVCEKLLEGDGIRKSALREELGMTKQQLDKALEALESKQVIKELEEEKDPRVWFRDELLE
jgi:DNA-binding XRE family transcriptional regulator